MLLVTFINQLEYPWGCVYNNIISIGTLVTAEYEKFIEYIKIFVNLTAKVKAQLLSGFKTLKYKPYGL